MEIEFEPTKDANNIAKHGVSLALAGSLEWDLLLATEDTRERYGDVRMVGFAPIGRKVYCVVFTEAGDVYRIISLRKALPKQDQVGRQHGSARNGYRGGTRTIRRPGLFHLASGPSLY